jgi:hypothetical protein
MGKINLCRGAGVRTRMVALGILFALVSLMLIAVPDVRASLLSETFHISSQGSGSEISGSFIFDTATDTVHSVSINGGAYVVDSVFHDSVTDSMILFRLSPPDNTVVSGGTLFLFLPPGGGLSEIGTQPIQALYSPPLPPNISGFEINLLGTLTTSSVPEPTSLWFLGSSLLGIAAVRGRLKK